MLEKFRAAKARELAYLRELEAQNKLPAPYSGFRPSFNFALRKRKGISVIAEYKRASPSKGVINLGLEPEDVARGYLEGGASAISVLTEEDHFQGSLEYLERMYGTNLPLLRKDFILDPLQITQTLATKASALLLIARMLGERELVDLNAQSLKAGLDPVVEVFGREDLEKAKHVGAKIIQVNNRDLDTLDISLDVSASLITEKEPEEIWISASGILNSADLKAVKDMGFDAALIGTSLMSGGDPGQALANLLKGVDS